MNSRFLRNTTCFHTQIREYVVKRKFPLAPDHDKDLPVFDYSTSKENYRRIFVWGGCSTGCLGIRYMNKQLKYIHSYSQPRRLTIGEKYEVRSVACGFGFSAFAVNSDTNIKLFGTGLNTDSQIGYHSILKDKPMEIIFYPQPIYLPFKNPEKSKIRKVAAGRAHLVVLTDEGLFLFGNNAYGQCARKIIQNEKYIGSKMINRVGKIDGKKVVDITCGQDHTLAITEDGRVYGCGWGADGQTGVGHFNSVDQFTILGGDIASEKIVKIAGRSDFVLALNDKGEVFGWGNTEYGQLNNPNDIQQVCHPTFMKATKPLGKIKSVAASGSFCVVANEEGNVYVWGYGILGTGPKVNYSRDPMLIPPTLFGVNAFQPDTKVEKVSCGLSHICAVTNKGDLYTWGKNRHGSLGLGTKEDQFFPLRVAIGGIVNHVSCGVDHNIALCKPFI